MESELVVGEVSSDLSLRARARALQNHHARGWGKGFTKALGKFGVRRLPGEDEGWAFQ